MRGACSILSVSDQPAAAKSQSQSQAAEEPRYEADELQRASRALLGVSPHMAAGALAASDRKTHTISQAKQLIDEFESRTI